MILLIGGQQRAGKDTAFEYISQHKKFHKIALATPLKELVIDWYGQGKQREKLIAFGDLARAFDPDVFCRLAEESFDWGDTAITDCRYPNEFDYFRKYPNTKVLYIVAPEEVRRQRSGFTEAAIGHPSEGMIIPKDAYVIENAGTLEEFQGKLKNFIEEEFID